MTEDQNKLISHQVRHIHSGRLYAMKEYTHGDFGSEVKQLTSLIINGCISTNANGY